MAAARTAGTAGENPASKTAAIAAHKNFAMHFIFESPAKSLQLAFIEAHGGKIVSQENPWC
jgi:hypothetical protein